MDQRTMETQTTRRTVLRAIAALGVTGLMAPLGVPRPAGAQGNRRGNSACALPGWWYTLRADISASYSPEAFAAPVHAPDFKSGVRL